MLSWLHGLPFMLSGKHLCISRSYCLGLLPADLPAFPASLHASDLSVVYVTQERDPPKVPQKGIHSSSGATSAGYDAGVRGKNCSMPYLHTSSLCCEVRQGWPVGGGGREEG